MDDKALIEKLQQLLLEIYVSGCLRFPGTDDMPLKEGERLFDIVIAAGEGRDFEPLGLPFPRAA